MIKKIKDFLQLRGPVPRTLDVACGTGQSTVALKEIASQVVGTDTYREMLARAPREARVRYVEAPAEDLPFEDGVVRLVTVALALHWFYRLRFHAEARRVLDSSGWLVVYDNRFLGEMKENPEHERGGIEKTTSHATPARPAIKSFLRRTSAESTGFDLSRGKVMPTRFRSLSKSSPATL